MEIEIRDAQHIPAAVLKAYRKRGFDAQHLSDDVHHFWNEGGEPVQALWSCLTEKALNWDDPTGFESWLPTLSRVLRQVSDPHQRIQYHSRLVALMAPLLPLPDLLRMRDLREEDWEFLRLKYQDEIAEDMTEPYTRDPDQRKDPAFPAPDTLQAEQLQKEIQLFIETQLQDYAYSADALQEFLAFQAIRETMDAYDLHRWLRWSCVWVVDQWVDRGLFNRYLWWDRFLDMSPPIRYAHGAIGVGASNMIAHHSARFIPTLAAEPDELAAFCAVCSKPSAKMLVSVDQTPFKHDETLWLQLATHTLQRGFLPGSISHTPGNAFSQRFYETFWSFFQTCADPSLARELARQMLRGNLSPEDQETIIRHCFARYQQQGGLNQYYWVALLESVQNGDVICALLDIDDTALRQALLAQYTRQQHKNWEPLYPFAEQHPLLIAEVWTTHRDMPLWRIMWKTGLDECRAWVATALCDQLSSCQSEDPEGPELADFFAELIHEDPRPLVECLHQNYLEKYWTIAPPGLALLWHLHLSEIDPLILTLLAQHHKIERVEQGVELTHEILVAQPDALLNVKPSLVVNLLPTLDQSLLERMSPQLLKITGKSGAQALRDGLVTLFTRFEPDLLNRLGWLDKTTKNVRQACLDILIHHPHPDALAQLRTLSQTAGLDQASKDRMLSHLEASGERVEELDEQASASLADLVEQAVKLKKVNKTVETIYDENLSTLLPDVQPELVRWLLHQLATDKGEHIPRSVDRIMQPCPLDQRQRFVAALVQQWLAHNGDPKLRWLLRLIPYGADDRLVSPFVEAVKAWQKKHKQRAAHAIHAMASLDSVFALSQVKIISETNKYTHLLLETAMAGLREAAKRRQQPLMDLYDELVPDFGLGGEGLELDVGPYAYRLELQRDLSLLVRSPNGKATKSLPKAKPEEDAAKRRDVEDTLKRVRGAIKIVSKQQAKRMQNALLGARTWPASRWRRLFADHLLLRQVAQSLIWSRQAEDDSAIDTFRLSEDLSLIDHQDESVVLQDGDTIALWHPLVSDEETIDGWRQHLDDYAITPLIEQVNLPRLTLKPEWLEGTDITAYQGHVLSQSKLTSKMNQWGYFTGPVEDGPGIYQHYLRLPEASVRVDLHHSQMMPFFMQFDERIAIECMRIYPLGEAGKAAHGVDDYQAIPPEKLAPITLSVLLAQLQKLAESGEGYQKNWRNI